MDDNERTEILLAIQALEGKVDTVVTATTGHAEKLDIVFHPTKGLYAMVGRNTVSRKAITKGMWLIGSGILGIIFYLIKEAL